MEKPHLRKHTYCHNLADENSYIFFLPPFVYLRKYWDNKTFLSITVLPVLHVQVQDLYAIYALTVQNYNDWHYFSTQFSFKYMSKWKRSKTYIL